MVSVEKNIADIKSPITICFNGKSITNVCITVSTIACADISHAEISVIYFMNSVLSIMWYSKRGPVNFYLSF
jgi:hypothetical protein